jgi:hypothetical protein
MLRDEALLPTSIPEMIDDEVESDDQEIAQWVKRFGGELLFAMDGQNHPV